MEYKINEGVLIYSSTFYWGYLLIAFLVAILVLKITRNEPSVRSTPVRAYIGAPIFLGIFWPVTLLGTYIYCITNR